MDKDTQEFKFNNLGIIHNTDIGNYYSVFGVTTLIVLLMLLWFFIRTNISHNHGKCREHMFPIERSDVLSMMPEFQEKDIKPIKLTDEKYNIKSGDYGGVAVNFYDMSDTIYDREWDTYNGVYLPNSRTLFKKVNSPYQALLMQEPTAINNLDVLDKQPEASKPAELKDNIKTAISNVADKVKNMVGGTESMSERMSCKERMGCKERMSDYICYRCGKYAYECECYKKIDTFNPICPYCKQDVKDCICYMTDYHSYMWRNRYYDRATL